MIMVDTAGRRHGMYSKLIALVSAHYIILARSFTVILGGLAVWWGITGFPVYWQDSSIERMASRIIAGDQFKFETLAQQLPTIDGIERSANCRPAALRSATIIRLRMLEIEAAEKDGRQLDEHFKSLTNAVQRSLSCAPADPFLWLALYLVEVTENGFNSDYAKYLRLSYQLGAHEGWILLKRNPVAFKTFQQLPPDLREYAINEFFAMLLEAHFTDQAVEIFFGPAWPERDLILSQLTRLSGADRQRFADAVSRRGYDLDVPGIGLAPKDSHRFAPNIRVPQ
jgi:hypothetical protein